MPPVKLVKVSSLYFVVDGHHPISVMRQQGQSFVDAHVIEMESTVGIQSVAELQQALSISKAA